MKNIPGNGLVSCALTVALGGVGACAAIRPPAVPEPVPAPSPAASTELSPGLTAAPPPEQAPVLPPLEPLVLSQLEDTRRLADLDEQTLSLQIAEATPVQEVLFMLVRDTPISLVPEPGVSGSFTGELKNVTLRQAFDLVLRPLGLDYRTDDRVVRVFPRQMTTRIFEIDHLAGQRIVRRTSGDTTDGAYGVAVSQVTIDDAQDFFSALLEGVGSLLSERGRFSLDRKSGLLQVTDLDERLDAVRVLVDRAQMRAHVQVQIESQIVEVELTDRSRSAIDWAAVVRVASRPGAASRGVRSIAALVDFSSVVAALNQQGRVTVRSSPTLVTLNNEPVVMRSGARGGWIDGVDLTVTPQVSATGLVSLSVSPSIRESLVAGAPESAQLPVVSVREIDTVVQVQSGDTVALTGLLGGTPQARTEIVVLLKPTIVPRS